MANSDSENSIKKQPIIVKKIKGKGHGAHGSAWKLAYADFVTAMMAFFLLMWLVNASSKDTLKGIAKYFTPVEGIKGSIGTNLHGGKDVNSKEGMLTSSTPNVIAPGNPERDVLNDTKSVLDNSDNQKFLSIVNNLQQAMNQGAELSEFKDNLIVQVTPEGLQIQIMDSYNRSIFEPNSSKLAPYTIKLISNIANLIKSLPNYISIEGHVASLIDTNTKINIDKWQLSNERANEIRKFLSSQTKKEQIIRLIGKADKEPYDTKDLANPQNMRVILTLLNSSAVSAHQKAAPDSLMKE